MTTRGEEAVGGGAKPHGMTVPLISSATLALVVALTGAAPLAAQSVAPSVVPVTAASPAVPKRVIGSAADIPRFAYPVSLPPSRLIVADDATFAAFAAAVGADVDRVLRDDDIRDAATLRDFLLTKLSLQLLAGDESGVRATLAAVRAAQPKPDERLLIGRLMLVRLDALAQPASGTSLESTEIALDRAAVAALPWDVVQAQIRAQYGGEQGYSPDRVIGSIQHGLDPIVAKTGTLDGDSARSLVQTRAFMRFTAPLYAIDVPILKAYIAQHAVVKPAIWAARDVTITASEAKAPVTIGVWDNGVDPADYPGALYLDAHGRHGIAFNDDGSPSSSDLYTLQPDTVAHYAQDVRYLAGTFDAQIGLDSPDADAFHAYVKSLSVAQSATFATRLEDIDRYFHGSHVAGIALRGNAAARIVVARFDDNIDDLPFPPTEAWVRKMAADFASFGTYFRANHVRVVNMSWGDQVSEFEHWIAKTDTISDPQVREARAKRFFAIWSAAIADVIAGTPGTLFVASAGNGDNDSSFAQTVPSSLRTPNLIVVGAVDQAGDATAFTSYGPTVAVYADGLHVVSKIPGGYDVPLSGTSMAAPQVANLAGKLLALDPSLTPVEVRALIVDGATRSDDGKRLLIDPKGSVALLKRRMTP